MNTPRRRGIVLVEMLTVIFLFTLGSGLALMVFESLVHAQSAAARFSAREAMLHDFQETLRRDVRRAERIEAVNDADDATHRRVALVRGEERVVYDVSLGAVTRTVVSSQASRSWDETLGLVDWELIADAAGRPVGLRWTVTWTRPSKGDLDPRMVFERAALCAGEEAAHE